MLCLASSPFPPCLLPAKLETVFSALMIPLASASACPTAKIPLCWAKSRDSPAPELCRKMSGSSNPSSWKCATAQSIAVFTSLFPVMTAARRAPLVLKPRTQSCCTINSSAVIEGDLKQMLVFKYFVSISNAFSTSCRIDKLTSLSSSKSIAIPSCSKLGIGFNIETSWRTGFCTIFDTHPSKMFLARWFQSELFAAWSLSTSMNCRTFSNSCISLDGESSHVLLVISSELLLASSTWNNFKIVWNISLPSDWACPRCCIAMVHNCFFIRMSVYKSDATRSATAWTRPFSSSPSSELLSPPCCRRKISLSNRKQIEAAAPWYPAIDEHFTIMVLTFIEFLSNPIISANCITYSPGGGGRLLASKVTSDGSQESRLAKYSAMSWFDLSEKCAFPQSGSPAIIDVGFSARTESMISIGAVAWNVDRLRRGPLLVGPPTSQFRTSLTKRTTSR